MVLFAVVAAAAWLVAYGTGGGGAVAAETPAEAPTIEAAVEADGVPVGPTDGWRITRTGSGRYELDFDTPMHVVVRSWEQMATVVMRPTAERQWLIEFIDGHRAIDSTFSFAATPIP